MHAMRIPSTGIWGIDFYAVKSRKGRQRLAGSGFRLLQDWHSGMADPMPPNVSDTFIILKPRGEWPDQSMNKADFLEKKAGQSGWSGSRK